MVSDVFDIKIHRMASFFYVDDGLIASTFPDWIQWAIEVLMVLFKLVGLWENYGKTVRLIFQIYHIFVRNSDTAYGQWMTGERGTYRSHK